ncbi:MAG TPA: putative lipid II flippase FtsW [Spirochaetaceae bacterium]|jgi:cell division protein FtsW|nr:putative lipid II flippase FtsW [Spirochaetaceae bacterium]
MSDAFSMERPLGRSKGDGALLGALVLAAGLGLAHLYSASYGYALALGRGASYFALRQALWLLPAAAAFMVIAMVPLSFWRSLAGPVVLLSIALLVLPFIPGLGIVKNGASRWFGFGSLSFQPSELFKPALVLYLAHILAKKEERLNDIMRGVLPPLLLIGLGIAIVLFQNDFSTAIILAGIALCMFWIAKVPLIFFAAASSVGLPLLALTVLTSDYRLKRVVGFLAPRFDPADLSYQVNGSIKAIRAGGLWGRGIGQGSLKLRSIPLVLSDFIFSAWAEETGFIGVLVFILLWAFILYRAIRASFGAADSYRSYLAFGMAFYLGLQTLINILVAVGAVPATGMPLPLFSSGGSALLSVVIASGFIYAVSREQRADARHEGRTSND